MNLLENAKMIEIEKLIKENNLMKQLSGVQGFFKYYYSQCKDFQTKKEAFDHTNEVYFNLFGRFRFSDYGSFKNVLSYHNNKK
jgi:hypothetical protein